MDFPPLTTASGGSGQEKKVVPVVSGAWGSSRPVLSPTTNGNVNVSPGGQQSPNLGFKGMEDVERGGKPAEVFTPKLVRRPPPAAAAINGQGQGPPRGKEATGVAILTGQVASINLGMAGEDKDASDSAASASVSAVPQSVAPSSPSP